MKKTIWKVRRKLHSCKAFSLVELLFSILILMLSTTVIIQCFNLGVGNFVRETRASEAQLLCSALATSIQNELSYAQDIKIDGSGKLESYYSCARRMGSGSKIIVDDGQLFITSDDVTDAYPLVAPSNYTASNRAGVKGGGKFFIAYLKDNAIEWNASKKVFEVTIWVDDATKAPLSADAAKDNALAYSKFCVKPMAGAE
ncbi:MAG: hypothetical protein E7302_00205 [Butyrivibrio sp.]|nr:hypothetical protein [Butyrivibrio sp.]